MPDEDVRGIETPVVAGETVWLLEVGFTLIPSAGSVDKGLTLVGITKRVVAETFVRWLEDELLSI